MEKLREILLPKDREQETPEGFLTVSDDPYDNLMGAIIDLEHEEADAVSIETCKRVARRIRRAQEILKTNAPAKLVDERG